MHGFKGSRGWAGLAAVTALGLLLQGCGGGGGGTQAASDDRATVAAKPPPPRAPVEPLSMVTPPDVNKLGLLDGTGPNAGQWTRVTNAGQQTELQRLGKALFWDMQVGGDGILACASCHYNAGADNRVTHQISPGLKGGDRVADLKALNATLALGDYAPAGAPNRGLPVSEAALLALGAVADAPDGTPGRAGDKPSPALDVNDVVSSQGIRGGVHEGVTTHRVDTARLLVKDPGFDVLGVSWKEASGLPDTVRRVEPRNSPTTINAVFNLRQFWDGRADMFFNGVNPLGMRDPAARVKVALTDGGIGDERLDVPFSSLASQAVGPIESHFEMVYGDPDNGRMPRSFRELGKKLTLPGVIPLRGQLIAANDSLFAGAIRTGGRGLNGDYPAMIRAVFDRRFWDSNQCFDSTGAKVVDANGVNVLAVNRTCAEGYTLMQYNFPLFFGLAVQAYEATLVSGQTIVDLIAGGIATGTVTNGRNVVNVTGLALDGCIALVAANTSAAQQALATSLCTTHYAKFIHPKAVTGAESPTSPFPVPAGTLIGGQCGTGLANTSAVPTNLSCTHARNTLLNVNRGLGRFFAGATACAVCHFNPEFTGATVSTMTGFGIAPELLPPGQARRAEQRAVMERMPTFNGAAAVYDTGFYNIGARPTYEDLSLGDAINGVPIALSKLFDIMNGGNATGFDTGTIGSLANPAPGTIAAKVANAANELRIPFAPNDLRPIAFPFNVGCGVGLVGGGNANNNPNVNCNANVVPGERLLRNGAFKAPGLRNVKFTGPYLHNGSKMNLRQVMEFYKTAGHFTTLNFNNLDAGMRVFALAPADESALVEMMETGLTDWRVAHQEGVFDHPEICIPNGHDPGTGTTRLVAIPAVGSTGGPRIATFEEVLREQAAGLANNLQAACSVVDGEVPIADGGLSRIDWLPLFAESDTPLLAP